MGLQGDVTIGFVAELKVSSKPIQFVLEQKSLSNASLLTGMIAPEQEQSIRDLVQAIDQDLGASIPEGWRITLKKALFVLYKSKVQGSKLAYIFGIDIATNISLADLPLVGQRIPPDQVLNLERIQILVTSQEFTDKTFNLLKSQPQLGDFLQKAELLPQGINLAPHLQFGKTEQAFFLPLSKNKKTQPPASPVKSATNKPEPGNAETVENPPAPPPAEIEPPASPDGIKWFKLQKKIGPVSFERAGVKYEAGWLWLLLDMSLSIAQLTLTLDGLAAGFDTQKLIKLDPKGLIPKFDLRGIGISYKNGSDLEISGAFLRSVITETDKSTTRDEYSGAVVLKTKAFTLSAIGSYTELNGHPSLFIYAFLDKSLGGPAFFFVTGLAAGFGYNRKLIRPTLDGIRDFPLVQMAMGSGGNNAGTGSLTSILGRLQPYVPPAPGEMFLAIGVKFTSFKIIDSFALLIASFGSKFQLTLLGISKIVSPPPIEGVTVTPVAEVQIALKADFIPDEGILRVDGKILPGSYILSHQCTLSGGFAFYSWFSGEHEGDFVLTVGGYHPKFQIPDHYPRCDRLALNWKVDDNLSIKGQAYFALTSAAIMAGGRLEATWQTGNLNVWFVAIADFILAWKPYFYDITLSLSIVASYTFDLSVRAFGQELFCIRQTLTTNVSADLHIWGPEFAGTARISWTVISFTVDFGKKSSPQALPIDWDEFKQSFLPPEQKICSISVQGGLIKTLGEGTAARWVINPKEFVLVFNTAIPLKAKNDDSFGIGAMGVNSKQLSSEHTIDIKKIDIKKDGEDVKKMFDCSLSIAKSVPSGLWGDTAAGKAKPADLNGKPIPNVVCGYEIKPAQQTGSGSSTPPIDCSVLSQNPDDYPARYQWEDFTLPQAQEAQSKDVLRLPDQLNISNLKQVLGSDREDFKINPPIFDDLLVKPLIIKQPIGAVQ